MKKRTTDLFRFVTLRTPESITKKKKKLGFVTHSTPENSHFLGLLDPGDDLATRKAAVIGAIATFSPVLAVEELKLLNPELWEFSQWLLINKNNLDKAKVVEFESAITIPTEDIELLWDNVFFDILTLKNPYVRQGAIQMLVAHYFLTNYQDYEAVIMNDEEDAKRLLLEVKELKRLANAKILAPQEFTTSKNLNFLTTINSTQNSDKQASVHENLIKGLSVKQLTVLLDQIDAVDKEYKQKYNTEYTKQLGDYQAATKTQINGYIAANPAIFNQTIAKEKTSETTTNDSKKSGSVLEKFTETEKLNPEKLIPKNLVSPFTFRFDETPLSDEFLADVKAPIKEFKQFLAENTLKSTELNDIKIDLLKQLKSSKSSENNTYRRKIKEILINGATFRVNRTIPLDFALSFFYTNNLGQSVYQDPQSIYFSLNAGYSGAFFEEMSYKLTFGEDEYEATKYEQMQTKGNQLFIHLFTQDEISAIPGSGNFDFEMNFTLNNGVSYRINKKGNIANLVLTGFATPLFFIGEEPELYGINKIGVADYRRVEQELCCYIPGEVSHIENVMAREYKEKSTRNFISTSNTLDYTTERENEKTNDTTTTTRHELSSEIAEVIQKDKASNIGFNASVHGDYGKTFGFNAGANGDFSNSTSTSNSNSQARIYAEDVTKRAVERIVQKVSIRRSSTILKEFEENNKHGFDNRKGTAHVTGIYRWIDKVYKNRIVNYGKRLMYEFMVPEPARFYKEAVLMQAEEEVLSSNLDGSGGDQNIAMKPIHPSECEYKIESFRDITRDNYVPLGVMYNVSVQIPKAQFNTISKVVSGQPGDKDEDHTASVPSPMLGEYECIRIRGLLTFSYEALVPTFARFRFRVSNYDFNIDNMAGKLSITIPVLSNCSPALKDSFDFAVDSYKVTSYSSNLSLDCEWSIENYEKWQQSVYDAIIQAYETQLQIYNEAQLSKELAENAKIELMKEELESSRNPRFNAEIVNVELKRLCIEMMTKPFGIQQGMDFYQNGQCNVPELRLSAQLDKYAQIVTFFEQAFDWNLISQKFYPYYWAKKCDWVNLFQGQSSDDYIFQAFLQSGMGRVIVPVKLGFEDAVAFFMETGQVWNGTGIAIDMDDELYVSLVDEVMNIEGVVEGEEWETIIPTDLTIIQAKSALLQEEGLPCCNTDEEVLAQLTLKPDTNILKFEDDPSEETEEETEEETPA